MSVEELLVFEHGGTSWGVARAEVRGFGAAGGGVAVTLRHGRVRADRVVGMLPAPVVARPGRVLRRFWPVHARGLAVVGGRVVVVIDPLAPPPGLAPEIEGGADA
ncbi:MAG TPA: hypothetical protein P5234_07880 [Thermoanaerobaculaceae bacterium]|nr:hypothetical protein [Thermoanaerobaculaceae bacterium]HRS16157.1 hypothetical protein [Thermoanaerobaculaceae bacterium]